jgi:hypothetical protein
MTPRIPLLRRLWLLFIGLGLTALVLGCCVWPIVGLGTSVVLTLRAVLGIAFSEDLLRLSVVLKEWDLEIYILVILAGVVVTIDNAILDGRIRRMFIGR